MNTHTSISIRPASILRTIPALFVSMALLAGAACTHASDQSASNQAKSGAGGPNVKTPSAAQTNASSGTGKPLKIFNDPNQNAFSIAVPADWAVDGGSFPMSVSDVRFYVRAVSPDGAIELFVGDRNVGAFMTMNPALEMACRQGQRQFCLGGTYPFPDGTRVQIQQYMTGGQFAAAWGKLRVAQSCSGVQPLKSDELPQASQNISLANGTMQVSDRAGEAQFQCTHGGVPGEGYVFAATELGQQANGEAMWQVKALTGFIANKNQEAEAWHLLPIVAGSFRINQKWLAQHNQSAQAAADAVARVGVAESNSLNEAFQEKMSANQVSTDNWSRYLRGQALFNDPDLGQVNYENYPHMWKMPDGTRVGTDSADAPVVGAEEIPRANTSAY